MTRRLFVAGAVLVGWLAGLGMLVRREYFRPHFARLAEAALRVTPGAVFYAVMVGDRQVGFASSTIDTTLTEITQRDYLVADLPVGDTLHRTTARTNITLTRALRLRNFEVSVDDKSPIRVDGQVIGDSVLQLAVGAHANAKPDTQRLSLSGPMLLPNLVPLAVVLESRPRVGKSYVIPVFDPTTLAEREVRVEVRAESLFVVNDSSVFDSTSGRWYGVLPNSIRAWQVVSQGGAGVSGWVDEQGRMVSTTQMGFRLQRMPYEVAFENWRRAAEADSGRGGAVAGNRNVVESTVIAAGKRPRTAVGRLRVRLIGGGLRLGNYEVAGGRQQVRGDTVIVQRESDLAMQPRYVLPDTNARRAHPMTRGEALMEVDDPEIRALSRRIAAQSRDPRAVAERINAWVYDSLRKEPTAGLPSALRVLRARSGDANGHTQLFVALARAAGIPARVASGLAYVDGKFYYHAWPEILLRGWVAVDPTFGQFPADASHLRLLVGGLAREAELLRLMGGLTIDVIEAR